MYIKFGYTCDNCGFQKFEITCKECGGIVVWDTDNQCAVCPSCSSVILGEDCLKCGFRIGYNKKNMRIIEQPSIKVPGIAVAPVQKAVAPEAQPKSPPSGPPCPTCNGATQFITQYNRYYCYHCQKYVALPNPPCPICNGVTQFITQYNRYYCNHCQKYI